MQTIGDLARGLALQNRQNVIKDKLEDLTTEMTTGIKADPALDLAGDTTRISHLQTGLSRIQAYLLANTEAELAVDATQAVLSDIQSQTEKLGVDFLKVDLATSPQARSAMSHSARETFSTLVSRLNTSVVGRSLFAGTATQQAPLKTSSEMLDDLKSHLLGATTAAEVMDRLDFWFDDPAGGFNTQAYLGSKTDLQPYQLSETETVELSVRADNSVFRNLMKQAAIGHLAADQNLAFTDNVQTALLSQAGRGIVNGQTALTNLRADVGSVQERISETRNRNEANQNTLRLARNSIVSADPYQTATRLEQVQAQLEALYVVTSRNREISLVNFLR
ncbi:MAG: flagellin [Pseudoprimorskyibacter sp.]|jgi:flagellar hook-associated protein 3 FlgL|nr:flagellin [Pseudoprimorskyibacter sp.]